MALADLTEDSVRRALAQFRELGRDAFLERYGFGKARGYFVVDGDLLCDSKAIAGAAHGFLRGMAPLGPNISAVANALWRGIFASSDLR